MKAIKLLTLFLVLLVCACGNKKAPPAQQPSTLLPVDSEVAVENLQVEEAFPDQSFIQNSVVYFDFDVATPQVIEIEKVINQANWLKAHPNYKEVIIEGHTDIYGTTEYNLALGEKRANAVKDILVKNGINPRKVKVVSYGKEQLANPNIQSQNRRTVTKVIR